MTRITGASAVFTDLVLAIFRLHGHLMAEGDRLTEPFGLSSARWKVLGAVQVEGRSMTVAQIARRMGLTRQAVQRIAGDLEAGGFVEFIDNPDHRTAKLMRLTAEGEHKYDAVTERYAQWAEMLIAGMTAEDLGQTLGVVNELEERLDRTPAPQ